MIWSQFPLSGGLGDLPSCGAYLERRRSVARAHLAKRLCMVISKLIGSVPRGGRGRLYGTRNDDDTISLCRRFRPRFRCTRARPSSDPARESRREALCDRTGPPRERHCRYPVGGQRNLLAPPVPLQTGEERLVSLGWKIVLARTPFTIKYQEAPAPADRLLQMMIGCIRSKPGAIGSTDAVRNCHSGFVASRGRCLGTMMAIPREGV